MRSPAVVFSLAAVSALSPSLIFASPLPSRVNSASAVEHRRGSAPVAPRGLGFLNGVFTRSTTDDAPKPHYTSQPKIASVAGYTLGYVLLKIHQTSD